MAGAAYTDLTALARYRSSDTNALPAVARQFESMFVDMMLKAAREATAVLAEGNPFDSFESKLHQEMLDHQLAVSMSEHGGIGLADVLLRQLGGKPHTAVVAGSAAPASAAADGAAGPSPRRRGPSSATLAAVQRWQADANRHTASTDGALPVQARSEKQRAFADPVDFVRRVLPAVRRATEHTPFAPLAVLAQAALETGWGRAVIGDGQGGSSNNLFGIKSAGPWRGPSATVETLEVRNGSARREQAAFRVYDSIDTAVRDLVQTLHGAARYSEVVSAADAEGYAEAIGRAGYATDPEYGRKLQQILGSDTLREALDAVLREEGRVQSSGRQPSSDQSTARQ